MVGSLGTISGQVRLDVRQAVASYAALRAQNQRTVYALRGAGDAFTQAGKTSLVAGGLILYGFSKAVNAAAEFERKMDYAAAVSDTTGKKMAKLSDYALQLGQDTIYSAGEVADGFIELAKAGLSAEQIIGGIGKAMTDLSAAADIPLDQSGQIITSTIQQFDLAAKDAVHVTDLLAGAANASIADISDIGVALKYVGGVANASGLKLEDTTTAISLLAKAGIRGSTAGTSLRQMIVSLGGSTGPARQALSEIGVLSEDGSNAFYDQEGNTKKLAQVFQILQNKLAGYNNKQKLAYLRTIFNNRALSAASILTRDGAEGFREMAKEMNKVKAADVAAERLNNLSGDIEILSGNIETLLVKTGGPFQEQLRGWVQQLTKLVQAFADLDPETQTAIIRFTALAGVALVIMGAVSLIVGTILRFISSVLLMGNALSFVGKFFKIFGKVIIFLLKFLKGPLIAAFSALATALGITVGALAAIVAVVLIVVAALVILYKKWEPFRNLVNNVVKALINAGKAVGNFVKNVVTNPGKALDSLKSIFGSVVGFFQGLGGKIKSALTSGLDAVGNFVLTVINFFVNLPGKVLSVVSSFISTVVSLFTFRNIGYALGFVIGTIVGFFLRLGIRVGTIVLSLVTRLVNFFKGLGPKIGAALAQMVVSAVNRFIQLKNGAISAVTNLLGKVINLFRTLPPKVIGFITRMVTQGINKMINFAVQAPAKAKQLVNKVVNFFRALPTKVTQFFATLVTKAVAKMTQLKTKAVDIGLKIRNGLTDGIRGLPGLVSGIFNNILSAIKEKITEAFNSVKDFASGMWEGFKSGLGINSPSYIEEAVWQMTGVVGEETKKLAKQTMDIQKLSKKMAKTSFTVGDPGAPSASDKYRKLATTHNNNRNRSRELADSLGRRKDNADRSSSSGGGGKSRLVEGQLRLHPDGRAFIEGVAEDVVDNNENFKAARERQR